MNTQLINGSFVGFDFHVSNIQKYLRAGDIFTIMLKDGTIVHYTSNEEDQFENWLMQNNIESIKIERFKTPI